MDDRLNLGACCGFATIMAVPQITIRLDPASKGLFDGYADSLGLMASELFKLLIVRERHLRRLAAMAQDGQIPSRRRRSAGKGIRLPTVTAHLSAIEQVTEFDLYAQECGLNRNGAGALLLEMELNEQWLAQALKIPALS